MRIATTAGIVTLLLAVNASADKHCSHTMPRNAATSAAGVTRIVVRAQAGTLKIEGTPGAAAITANGIACSSDDEFVSSINFHMRRNGSELLIETDIPEKSFVGLGWFEARLDLDIAIPTGIPLVVDDGSGATRIENVGPTEIEDGSGELVIRGVHGDLRVQDGSGSLRIEDVQGKLDIEDGSGAIEVRNVTGDVTVDDNSGEMDISHIDGNVTVVDDSSGAILIRQVKKNVRIDDDGSGGIDVTDVDGDFTVRRKGSGGVDFARVSGRVSVPRG